MCNIHHLGDPSNPILYFRNSILSMIGRAVLSMTRLKPRGSAGTRGLLPNKISPPSSLKMRQL